MTASAPPLPAHVQLTRQLAVASLLALIVLVLGWELFWAPLRPGGSWLALKALPFGGAPVARMQSQFP